METWLLADRAALEAVFGRRMKSAALPASDASLEMVRKDAVYETLSLATKATDAGPYGKGRHSFHVLARVEPRSLRTLSWAARFLDEMGAAP